MIDRPEFKVTLFIQSILINSIYSYISHESLDKVHVLGQLYATSTFSSYKHVFGGAAYLWRKYASFRVFAFSLSYIHWQTKGYKHEIRQSVTFPCVWPFVDVSIDNQKLISFVRLTKEDCLDFIRVIRFRNYPRRN
jgi:hypothetical protein